MRSKPAAGSIPKTADARSSESISTSARTIVPQLTRTRCATRSTPLRVPRSRTTPWSMVAAQAEGYEHVMVFLDSNHTHEHVLAELELYAPYVSKGSYCVVWDTGVEDLPNEMCADRPWGKGNNPKTAVWEYMRQLEDGSRIARDGGSLRFEYDHTIEHKLMITASPDGFLKRV